MVSRRSSVEDDISSSTHNIQLGEQVEQMQTVDVAFHDAVGSGVLPKLPTEVYEDRFERCRALMAERSLDVLVIYSAAMPFASCEWARYFANYVHPYWNS